MPDNVIVKLTHRCNLDCPHCGFFATRANPLKAHAKTRRDLSLKEVELLFVRVKEYLSTHPFQRYFEFLWHGGEPLLTPRGFFREIIQLQRRILGIDYQLVNRIQTNGVLLDDARIDELQQHGIQINLSLDGPRHVHDVHRPTMDGKGSYWLVRAAIERLNRRSVPFGVTTVVHPDANGKEVLMHHRDIGVKAMDFLLPLRHYTYSTVKWPIDARFTAKLSDYLIGAFDEWFLSSKSSISVRRFSSLLSQMYTGVALVCTQDRNCGNGSIVMYDNGDMGLCECLDICDSFDHTGLTVNDAGVISRIEKLARYQHLKSGNDAVPDTCLTCVEFELCRAGCPVTRYHSGSFSKSVSIYCGVYRALYGHVRKRVYSSMVQFEADGCTHLPPPINDTA